MVTTVVGGMPDEMLAEGSPEEVYLPRDYCCSAGLDGVTNPEDTVHGVDVLMACTETSPIFWYEETGVCV